MTRLHHYRADESRVEVQAEAQIRPLHRTSHLSDGLVTDPSIDPLTQPELRPGTNGNHIRPVVSYLGISSKACRLVSNSDSRPSGSIPVISPSGNSTPKPCEKMSLL